MSRAKGDTNTTRETRFGTAWNTMNMGLGGPLQRETRCLVTFWAFLSILQSGDGAVGRTRELTSLLEEHQSLFLELWGETCIKPKFHLLFHVI